MENGHSARSDEEDIEDEEKIDDEEEKIDDGEENIDDEDEKLDDEEEFEEEEELDDDGSLLEADEVELPKSVSPDVMPGTSTMDVAGRPEYNEQHILDSSEDVDCTDEGEEGYEDGESSDDQSQENLTVTFRSDDTNEEIATATLILKRQDPVDNFLPFVGALLRSIQDEQMQLKLMDDISQFLINAKTVEIQRYRPRLQ